MQEAADDIAADDIVADDVAADDIAADDMALFAQGQALRAAGKWQEAIATLEAAAEVNPGRAETLLSLGVLRLQHQEFPAALALIERALAVRPGYAQAWDALGHVQAFLGAHDAAFEAFTRASALEPRHLLYLLHRTEAALKCDRVEAIKAAFEAALAADPLAPGQLVGLGLLAIRDRRIEDATDYLEAALALDDSDPETPMLLAIAYSMALLPGKAVPMLRLALARDPGNSRVVNDLAVMLGRIYCYEEAAGLLSASIEKDGPNVLSLSNLATAKAALGEMQLAAQTAREAMKLAPQDKRAAYAFCNLLPYQDDISAPYLLAALQHAAAVSAPPAPLVLGVSPVPGRPLRIGLLSNLLRTHPAGWLTLAGLEALDREMFSLHCFGKYEASDALAQRFAGFSTWHRTEAMDDLKAAQCIRDTKIDILIDLGGFGDAGRIEVCAYRPAPLQVKWVGMQYHSTGLPYIDYFITDDRETPPGYEAFYTEKLLRLPDGYVCYLPPAYAPEPGPLPAQRNGYVTFGCLNNLMKFTPSTLAAWAEILHGVPNSRLVLRCAQFSEPGARDRLARFFANLGISPQRLTFSGRASHREFLGTYNEIDIALDPFPYSGGLSTCESLYMGVPVLTRAGEIFAARHSLSHLCNVGMQEWIADSTDDYVSKAVSHAADLSKIAELRAGLRRRVVASPLCDAPRFGKNLGSALRKIWTEYCQAEAGK